MKETLSLHRLATVPLLALVICSCSAADAALGVDRGPEKNPDGGALTSVSVKRVDLGTLGGVSSYAADINSGNTVVGWSETPAGTTHAFRWSVAEGMVDLGTLPGDAMSRAVAVLDGGSPGGGQILGVSGGNGRWTPVVWSSSGSVSALPISLLPGFATALPTDFNARGDVVGSDAGGIGLQEGWVWSEAGGKYDLSANIQGGSNEGSASGVSASGVVVVTTRAYTCIRSAECWRTYLWTQTTGYTAIGTPDSDPEADVTGLGLNETATVVGWATSSGTSQVTPFSWAAGKGFTLLAHYSGGGYGYGTAVSSNGTVVGADFEPASGSIVASTWLASGAIAKLSPGDPNPSVAVAINDLGTVAGWVAVSNGVNHAVIWQPSSQATGVALRPSASVTAPVSAARVSTASTPCLADAHSITSRQALFECVSKADRK